MNTYIERSLARLVSEQTRLITKRTPLSDAEKCEFRARAKKINILLRRTRYERESKSLYLQLSTGILIVVLFVLWFSWKPRFVHADGRSPYILFDRTSKQLCWSGPLNDLQTFMSGSPTSQTIQQTPTNLPPCKE